jgi:hypothetical protein
MITAPRQLFTVLIGMVLVMTHAKYASASPGVAGGWRAYPNPFVTRFRVAMPESLIPMSDPEAQIRVFDLRGHMVRQWTFVTKGHELVIDWDGRTNSGAVAPSGWYIFDIRFKNLPLRDGIRFKMLRIRGVPSSTYDWQWF